MQGQGNPYFHFLISEVVAAFCSLVVYVFFRISAWATEQINSLFPLTDNGPAELFLHFLHWGGAIGGGLTFVLITIYQFPVLMKRLKAGGKNE